MGSKVSGFTAGIAAAMLIIGLVVGLLTSSAVFPGRGETVTITETEVVTRTKTVEKLPITPSTTSFKLGGSQVVGDIHFTVFNIAKEQGVFSKYVPNMEAIDFAGGTGELVRALADGTVDMGWGLTIGFAKARPKVDIRIVATVVETPLTWVTVVAADSPYKSVEDLRGKTFGVSRPGSGSHAMTLWSLSQRGWKEGVDFKISPLGKLDALVAGLKTGAIDALTWTLWSPLKPLINEGEVRIVQTILPKWPGYSLAVRSDFLEKNPEAVKATIFALQEAMRIFREDKSLVMDILMNVYKISREDAERWYSSTRYSADGAIFVEGIEEAINAWVATGAIKKYEANQLIAEGFAPIL